MTNHAPTPTVHEQAERSGLNGESERSLMQSTRALTRSHWNLHAMHTCDAYAFCNASSRLSLRSSTLCTTKHTLPPIHLRPLIHCRQQPTLGNAKNPDMGSVQAVKGNASRVAPLEIAFRLSVHPATCFGVQPNIQSSVEWFKWEVHV